MSDTSKSMLSFMPATSMATVKRSMLVAMAMIITRKEQLKKITMKMITTMHHIKMFTIDMLIQMMKTNNYNSDEYEFKVILIISTVFFKIV